MISNLDIQAAEAMRIDVPAFTMHPAVRCLAYQHVMVQGTSVSTEARGVDSRSIGGATVRNTITNVVLSEQRLGKKPSGIALPAALATTSGIPPRGRPVKTGL